MGYAKSSGGFLPARLAQHQSLHLAFEIIVAQSVTVKVPIVTHGNAPARQHERMIEFGRTRKPRRKRNVAKGRRQFVEIGSSCKLVTLLIRSKSARERDSPGK